MTFKAARFVSSFALAFVAAHLNFSARADTVSDFYKKSPITIYVSSAPGGGYDSDARLLARYLGSHIPGSPSVVVKNMPGAGGANAANYVNSVAPKDGTNLVMPQNTLTIDQFTSSPNVQFDMKKLEWIGSMNVNQQVCIFSKNVGPISAKDFFNKKFVVGASGGVTASDSLIPNLLNRLAGSKFEVINGYDGTAVVLLAVDRGEVQGLCGIGWDSAKVQVGERIKRGELAVGLDVGIEPDAELKAMGVPFLLDLVPEGVSKEALKLVLSVAPYGRPFAMAPGVPADRLAAVRKGFVDTMKDPAFIAEAQKINVQIQPAYPDEILKYINLPFTSDKAVQERAMDELLKAGWGGASSKKHK